MKHLCRTLLYSALVITLATKAYCQDLLSITYGSKIDGTTVSLFSNEAKVGYDSTTTALIAIGYFNDGFDVSTEKSSITDSASLGTFLGSFNKVSDSNFNAGTGGFLGAASGSITAVGEGKTPYILTLGGVTDWSQASSASEIGLFSDTSMSTIPAGAQPVPADYAAEAVSYGTVELGTEYLGEALSGAFAGFTGNIYASQVIGQAVPEPSTYALFLGIFSIGFVYWRKRTAKSASQEQS